MTRSAAVQVIKNKGRPEWAIIPYKDYVRLQALENVANDINAFKVALSRGDEELISDEYAHRLIQGESPVRVWREYRGLTQTKLAKAVKISKSYLSQLEHNERTASMPVLKKLAACLKVTLDDLV